MEIVLNTSQSYKLSELAKALNLNDTDLFYIEQNIDGKDVSIAVTWAVIKAAAGGGGGSSTWGSITGTLSDQTDLNTVLISKAPIDSPTFIGTPTAPTPGTLDESTRIATTEFVKIWVNSISTFVATLQADIDAAETAIVQLNTDLTIAEGQITTLQSDIERVKTQPIIIACSDEITDLTTGTSVVTFRMPFAFTLTGIRASVGTAPTGADIIVDVNENGTSILSTKISIDISDKTSTTAATPPVISDTSLADDAEITVDIDQIGSTVAGAGLKVYLIGYKTS